MAKQNILFIRVHNSARSQRGEASQEEPSQKVRTIRDSIQSRAEEWCEKMR
jgi:protein-tyrosine-phosphatase